MAAKKTPTQDRAVTKRDIVRVHAQANVLLGFLEEESDLLERAGIDPSAVVELEAGIKSIEDEIRVPKAKTMMMAALSRGMSREMILTLFHRATNAVHALAPIVLIKLAAFMDDDNEPGSQRVTIELAKGMGLLVPAQPMNPKNRAELITEERLSDRTNEDLKAEILRLT